MDQPGSPRIQTLAGWVRTRCHNQLVDAQFSSIICIFVTPSVQVFRFRSEKLFVQQYHQNKACLLITPPLITLLFNGLKKKHAARTEDAHACVRDWQDNCMQWACRSIHLPERHDHF